MSDFKDRCWGCEYNTGFDLPFNGENTITQCSLGYKNITISSGCSDFKPDITASCDRCFFYTTKESEGKYKPYCTVHNITSILSKNFPGGSGYCQEFYHRNNDDSSEEKKSGCFIATAVYDSPTAPKVMILRSFRDENLLHSSFGKAFVRSYYKYSPPFASFLGRHDFFKNLVRYLFIEPLVFIVQFFKKK